MRHPLRTHYILFFLFLTGTTFLAAQSGDIQLTQDPDVIYLPADIRIQSSARRDGDILVAWGSTYRDGTDSIRPGLVAQIVRNGQPVGSPTLIHSEAARPKGRVFVVPFDHGFNVIWNDVRNGEKGTYIRSLNEAGEPTGASELLIYPDHIDHLSTFGSYRTDGTLLYWKDVAGLQSMVRMMPRGILEGGPMRMPSIVTDAFSLPAGNGLLRMANGTGYKVDPSGRVNGDTTPSHMQGMYTVTEEGGICTIRDSIVAYYSDPFSAVPDVWIIWPELNSATGKLGLADYSTGEGFRLIYLVHDGYPPKWYRYMTGSFDYFDTLFDVRVSDEGRVVSSTHTVVRADTVDFNYTWDWEGGIYLDYLSGAVTTGCAGSELSVRWKWLRTSYRSSPSVIIDTISVGLTDGVRSTPSDIDSFECRTFKPWVSRISDSSVSAVRVVAGVDTIELHHEGVRVQQIGQRHPGLIVRNGELYLSFESDVARHSYSLERLATLGEDEPDRLGAPKFDALPEAGTGRLIETQTWHSTRLARGGNVAFVWHQQTRRDAHENVAGNPVGSTLSYRFDAHLATPDGWKRSGPDFSILRVYPPSGYQGSFSTLDSWSWNPNDSTLLIQYRHDEGRIRAVGLFDDLGQVLWVEPALSGHTYSLVIAIGGTEYLLVEGDSVHRFNRGNLEKSFALSSRNVASTYARLIGESFLRYARIDSTTLRIETYTLEGVLRRRADLPLPELARDLFVIQNPADSTLAVLWSADGIHVSFISSDLRVIEPDVRVSVTRSDAVSPAGVFRNDTLFVVWSDSRDAAPDIYCNLVPSPEVPPVADRWNGHGLHLDRHPDRGAVSVGWNNSISIVPSPDENELAPFSSGRLRVITIPNPTTGTTYVRFILRQESDVTVRLYDELGRTVWRFTEESLGSGTQWIPLDLRDVRPGVYTVVLTAGEAVGVGRIVRRP